MKALCLSIALLLLNGFVFTSEKAMKAALKKFCDTVDHHPNTVHLPSSLKCQHYFWVHILDSDLQTLVNRDLDALKHADPESK
jgi:hypothetical protein